MFGKKLFFGSSENEDEVSVEQVAQALDAQSHTLIDVRELDEWQGAHVDGAIHIPLGDLVARAGEIPTDKPIYTMCRSGARSLVAVKHLNQIGRTGAKSMAGGIIAWANDGKPVV